MRRSTDAGAARAVGHSKTRQTSLEGPVWRDLSGGLLRGTGNIPESMGSGYVVEPIRRGGSGRRMMTGG